MIRRLTADIEKGSMIGFVCEEIIHIARDCDRIIDFEFNGIKLDTTMSLDPYELAMCYDRLSNSRRLKHEQGTEDE